MEELKFVPRVVLALIVKRGELLLIRRRVPSFKVEWAFPGGVTKEGEPEEQAVVREAREEVGMDVEVKQKLLERKHPDTLVQFGYFYCEPVNEKLPEIGEPDEIAEIEWVRAENVLGKFTSDVHPVIKRFLTSHSL